MPQVSEILDGYLTKRDLARELHRNQRTVDRWHTQRIGPPRITVGNLVLFRREAVNEWLCSREQRRAAQ
jgi:predicted DNA-binding transcriptional regulator AlpA